MPYIRQKNREYYENTLSELIKLLGMKGWQAGEVTYVVYCIVLNWFSASPGYRTICAIRGMLSGVLSEFDRKEAFPYEDEKIKENGDI